jgi:hypothetical protein
MILLPQPPSQVLGLQMHTTPAWLVLCNSVMCAVTTIKIKIHNCSITTGIAYASYSLPPL